MMLKQESAITVEQLLPSKVIESCEVSCASSLPMACQQSFKHWSQSSVSSGHILGYDILEPVYITFFRVCLLEKFIFNNIISFFSHYRGF